MAAPIVVAEFRSVFRHSVGGPDKTILFSAARHDPGRVRIVPIFLVPDGDDAPALHALAARAGVEPVVIPDRARFDPALIARMRAVLRRHGCRILHTHDFKTDFLGLWIAPGLANLMATAHGWSRPTAWALRAYNAVDRWALRRYPLVLTVSRATALLLRRAGVPERRIRVLPNGVDTAVWRPRDPGAVRPPGLPADGRLLVSAARLSPDKDFASLVTAFTAVASGVPDVHLLIAGDGPEREGLERLRAASPASARIHLLGHRDDLPAVLGYADAFVLSSRAEGMPNSVLEAMASGLPVVATRVGGVEELVGDGAEALLVPPGDAVRLAEALSRVLGDPSLGRRLGASARRRAEAEFSFTDRVRRLEAIYEDVAAGRIPAGMDPAP